MQRKSSSEGSGKKLTWVEIGFLTALWVWVLATGLTAP